MNSDLPMPTDGNAVSVSDLAGVNYLNTLAALHQLLQPETYLEIGVSTGASLALAGCAAIAVDPAMRISSNVIGGKPTCHFFQMTSDRFFRHHSPTAILGQPVDLAFLDGLHYWEVLLRDIINTERHCRAGSVIALHDCVPTNVYIAERRNDYDRRKKLTPRPGDWAGDVWKVMLVLRRFRPDLTLHVLDAPPTGLVLLTGLDPESRTLEKNYFAIMEEYRDVTLLNYGIERYFSELTLLPAGNFLEFDYTLARLSL